MDLIHTREQLLSLKKELGVRDDWHEPDEQDLTAVVWGQRFDNAGHWPSEELGAFEPEMHELHVRLYRQTHDDNGQPVTDTEPIAAINLATLLAWATGHEDGRQDQYELGFREGHDRGYREGLARAQSEHTRVTTLREAAAVLTGLANAAEVFVERLTDEPGKITKLTGPNSVHHPGPTNG